MLYQETPSTDPTLLAKPAARSASTARPKPQRLLLEEKVIEWLDVQVKTDPGNRPAYEILSFEQTKTLLWMASKDVTSAEAIAKALDENQEWITRWGSSLYKLIFEFDMELASNKSAQDAQKRTRASRPSRQIGFVNQTPDDFKAAGPSNKRQKL